MEVGQVGEAMVVVVLPVVREHIPSTELALILDHRTADAPAQDLRLRHQHVIHSHVQVLRVPFYRVYIYIYIPSINRVLKN